jgi:hypothetical protein
MPAPVNEASDFPDQVEMPIGPDLRDAFSIQRVAQWAANRTRWLYDRLGGRRLATAAALKARTGMAAGDVVRVDGLGSYVFDPQSTATDDGVRVLAPNTGSGRWIHLGRDLLTNRIVGRGFKRLDGPLGVALAATVTNPLVVPNLNLSFADARAGDELFVEGVTLVRAASGAGMVRLGVRVDPGSPATPIDAQFDSPTLAPGQDTHLPLCVRHVIAANGVVTVTLTLVPQTGVAMSLFPPSAIRALLIRP